VDKRVFKRKTRQLKIVKGERKMKKKQRSKKRENQLEKGGERG